MRGRTEANNLRAECDQTVVVVGGDVIERDADWHAKTEKRGVNRVCRAGKTERGCRLLELLLGLCGNLFDWSHREKRLVNVLADAVELQLQPVDELVQALVDDAVDIRVNEFGLQAAQPLLGCIAKRPQR